MAKAKKWTKEEEERLLRQIEAFPQNLSKCFLIVGEELGRNPKAVAAHWYTSLSKREDVLMFFTASRRHISKNRKNGEGVESNLSIWNKLVKTIKSLFKGI